MKKLWSDISGLPVMLTEEIESENSKSPLSYAKNPLGAVKTSAKGLRRAGSPGSLNGVFMDPESGKIIAFMVGWSAVLSPVDIEKWEKDRIRISREDVLLHPKEILRLKKFGLRRTYLNGKKVLSASGRRMGRVRDFTIDTVNDCVTNFAVSKRFFGFEWDRRIFSFKDISEVKANAIILSVEPEDMSSAREEVLELTGSIRA